MSNCSRLKNDIISASQKAGFDPYKVSFKPSDLGLVASNYGSFADHCDKGEATSARHCNCKTLKRSERESGFRYFLR